jgi:hypothetical protein
MRVGYFYKFDSHQLLFTNENFEEIMYNNLYRQLAQGNPNSGKYPSVLGSIDYRRYEMSDK